MTVLSSEKNLTTMKKILIIEDDECFRSLLADFLSVVNFDVIEAENGSIGLKVAKEQLPNLIICDINMPGLNGYGVLNQLRKDLNTAKIPVIFLTSDITADSRQKALELGANGYLSKSVASTKLLEAIETQLD